MTASGHTEVECRTAKSEGTSDPGVLLPGMPQADGEPVFAEPWMAQAFAMAVQLHERGLFAWPDFAAALADEIAAAQRRGDADRGDTYYHHWLAALEALVESKGVASSEALARTRDAWDRAAHRTPHGAPIELRPEDFAG